MLEKDLLETLLSKFNIHVDAANDLETATLIKQVTAAARKLLTLLDPILFPKPPTTQVTIMDLLQISKEAKE